ncbi:MAG TPA: DMT family transporter [Burkholderiaceae bacterium]|nr:DMT family transporter [Burkholderiaceae bacterium]
MQTRDVGELILLSLLWGAAYLFMRAAVPAFGPAPLIALRLAIAAAVLLPVLMWRGGIGQLGAHPVALVVQAVPFTALPFLMLGFAAQHLTAGLMAVLNATAPLFAALLAHFVFHDRLGLWRSAGLVLGFGGVAWLTAGSVSFKSNQGLLAVGAVLLTSALWALGANYTRRRLGGMNSLALTVGSLAVASLALAPLATSTWPATPPSTRAWTEMAFLGVCSSGLGFLLYYRLLRRIGPVRAMSVTFLNPVVALVAGALYLGEVLDGQTVAGAAVVLAGTALALGLWPAATPSHGR